MYEWIESQEWSAELWFAAWFAAVVIVALAVTFFDRHLKH